jgi:lysyl-tRNA synthetase class 2
MVTLLDRQLRKLWSTLMPSTVIRNFRYDAPQGRLVVEFQSGRRYAYFNVPQQVYDDMRRARSRGSFFNAWVRDRYSYARLQ